MDDIEDRYGGWYDPELSPKGKLQAQETATLLKDKNVSAKIILSSPLKRAIQTATIIGQGLNTPVDSFVYLKERNTYGLLCGENKVTAKKKYPELVEAYEKGEEVLGYEVYDFLLKRITVLLSKLGNMQEGPVICVTHSKLLGAIFKNFLNKEAKKFEDNCVAEVEINSQGKANLIASSGIEFK